LHGALFLAQLPAYAKNVLGGDESSVILLLLATFIVGIGAGSLLCAKFVRHKPERSLALVLPGCNAALGIMGYQCLPELRCKGNNG